MMEHHFPVVLGKDFAGTVEAAGALEQAPEALRHLIEDRPFGTVTLIVDALSVR